MGVFSERLLGVFLVVLPWRQAVTSNTAGQPGHETGRECHTPAPTWQTWDMHSPTTSTMRADLEALRTYTRVR
jgi:hypothetical protein